MPANTTTKTISLPVPSATLPEPAWKGITTDTIHAPTGEESGDEVEPKKELLALGYETTRSQKAVVDGQPLTWKERVLTATPHFGSAEPYLVTILYDRALIDLISIPPDGIIIVCSLFL